MFSLVDVPTALPGSCYLCGSGTKQPFIDWGVSIDFHGALYTCRECTESVANLLGMASKEHYTSVLGHNARLNAENLELTIKNRALQQVVTSMQLAGFNEPIPNSDDQLSLPIADPEPDLLADDQEPDSSARATTEFLDFGTGTSDESRNDEGMDELRSTPSKSKRKYII